jgi:replicative DNA helicase
MYDLELECEFIKAVLDNSFALEEIQKTIVSNDLHFELTIILYDRIKLLHVNRGSISKGSLMAYLITSGDKQLLDPYSFEFSANQYNLDELRSMMYRLKNLSIKRAYAKLSSDIVTLIAKDDINGLILRTKEFSEGLDNLSTTNVVDMKTALKSTIDIITQKVEHLKQGISTGVPSGLVHYDKMYGGYQSTEVVIVAGRPGMAKSIVMLEGAVAAAKAGTGVLCFCLEMSKEALIDRIISGDLSDGGDRVKYSDLKRGQVSQNDMNRINTNTVNNLANLPIYWYDKDDRDISTISFEIEKYVKTGKVGIVYIDYVQLIENSEIKGGMSNSLISSISIKLKKLQKRLGIPIILLSQLSRKCEERSGDERRPRIADIRESGQLEQDASTVIGLYREDYYAYLVDPNAQMNYTIDIEVLKQRDGSLARLTHYIDVATSRIRGNKSDLRLDDNYVGFDVNYATNKGLDTVKVGF